MKQTYKLVNQPFTFQGVKGVGSITLNLQASQQVYAFIGENGVGKTKFLESLFATLLLSSKYINKLYANYFFVSSNNLSFSKLLINNQLIIEISDDISSQTHNPFMQLEHNLPIVYISALNRGQITHANSEYSTIKQLGNKEDRLHNYLNNSLSAFKKDSAYLKTLNMDSNIEEWIIQRAQSSNRFQSNDDNREIEITTLLKLLNQIDDRIDSEFLEISGNHRVFIKVMGNKTELSELSSGFTSILKILQAIIAGYSYYTNEKQIANVRGIVLIDEIESHLHNQWQVKIIPLLKQLFPNTIFFISTHSSLVISQLKQGEAYSLKRNKEDGVVYSHLINMPSHHSFADLLKDAFGVDLNQLAIKQTEQDSQCQAKQALLDLVNAELEKMGS